jgi:hypothetical protein
MRGLIELPHDGIVQRRLKAAQRRVTMAKATDDAKTMFQRMRDSDEATDNWMILEVKGDTAECINTGLGLDDLKQSLQDDKVQWALLRVLAVDQQDNISSRRTKIVQINWVGPRVPGVKRMGLFAGKSTISVLAQGAQVQVDCNERDDLSMVVLGKALLQCGGAHKPTHYDFGGDCSIALTELGYH